MPCRFKGKPRLSIKRILKLLKDGIYRVDLETGEVFGRKIGKPIYVRKIEGRDGKLYHYVHLYADGLQRKIPLSNLVWIAGAEREIPEGFEIHHKDTNTEHNWWLNLFCLAIPDHKKLHNGHKLIDEEEEETPF